MKMKSALLKSGFIEESINLMEQLRQKEQLTDEEKAFIQSVNEMCEVIQCWKDTKKNIDRSVDPCGYIKIK